jgi:cyclophilin family peptidyl-prolyl cis-trans isomerase
VTTPKGVIELELFEDQAPNTVANFLELVGSKFYDGVKFHRVLEGFMAQSGDPKGDGTGGPGYTIACECYTPEARRHFTGSLSMAKMPARDTGGSQFFIVFDRNEIVQRLDGKHTVFGRVLTGQDVVDALTRTHESTLTGEQQIAGVTPDTIVSAEVIRKRDHEYTVKKMGEVPAEQPAPTPPPAAPPAGGETPASGGEGGQP